MTREDDEKGLEKRNGVDADSLAVAVAPCPVCSFDIVSEWWTDLDPNVSICC